jgi:hypothetical protein
VFRLARVSSDDDAFLAELDLDPDGRVELLELLSGRIPANSVEELLDGPFRPLRKLRDRTRYSDGSYALFYSSLEARTAEAEVSFWFGKEYVGKPKRSRTAYYQGFRCMFDGVEKDLRFKVAEWPDLVHDSDYSFCNQLGAEARALGVDGLVVPSARDEGANMPIFARAALTDPKLDDVVAMTYRVDRNDVVVTRLSREVQPFRLDL